eukprot:snap_masked-scaffold_64-processed-gene-0.63-mRNA-1 protein AED:1.00 eAED:1.00 QI:0/0/0/0/1/1/2/0/90
MRLMSNKPYSISLDSEIIVSFWEETEITSGICKIILLSSRTFNVPVTVFIDFDVNIPLTCTCYVVRAPPPSMIMFRNSFLNLQESSIEYV